jgi:RNA polymerase sigma-70 factor, ECF subfamily
LVRSSVEEFERIALPHAQAALSLARALVRNDTDAEDVVQEAFLRAFKYFRGFSGEHPRAWLLSIVRNEGYAALRRKGKAEPMEDVDTETAPEASAPDSQGTGETPESALLRAADGLAVRRAVETLPAEFREVVVLRELQECSYKEIADIAQIPIGTVMSRLSRARKLLQTRLGDLGSGGTKA